MDSFITERDELPEIDSMFYIAEIILAIEHLHEMGVIHRDIKPANAFLGSDGDTALGNYGLRKKCPANNKVK